MHVYLKKNSRTVLALCKYPIKVVKKMQIKRMTKNKLLSSKNQNQCHVPGQR